jgi:hypothetical protein
MRLELCQKHLHTHVYCRTIYNSQAMETSRCPTTYIFLNGSRKCGIYTQWNFIQPPRRMKFYHLQVNGRTREHHLKQS